MWQPVAFPKMAEILKPGKHGEAEITIFEVSQQDSDLTRLRAAINRRWTEYIPAGRYAKLRSNGSLWMTDTKMEQDTCREFVRAARGDVFIAGLGIGMVLLAVQDKPEVTSVTVVEYDADVIALVVPQLPLNAKVRVVHADAFKWKPPRGQKFDTLWFDIWANICGDNARDFPVLRKHYARARKPGAWVGLWVEEEVTGRRPRRPRR